MDSWSKRCCSCELNKYAICSFVADETDGRLARKYKQTSTLGAVLDMVTDRYTFLSGCFVAKLRMVQPLHAMTSLDLSS